MPRCKASVTRENPEVGDDGAGADQVGEKSVERRLLEQYVPFFIIAFAAEAVGDEAGADGAQ